MVVAATPAELLTVKLLNTFEPLIVCAEDPLKSTVPDPEVKVPLLAQLPAILTVKAVPGLNVPVVIVRPPLRVKVVVLPPTLSVCAVLFNVRVLNVWLVAVQFILWLDDVLLKFMVPVDGVNVPPLFVQFPVIECVKVDALKVPEFNITFPIIVKAFAAVALVVPFRVKSPFTVNGEAGIVLVPLPLNIKFEYPVVEPLGLITGWALPLYSMVLRLLAAFKIPVDEREKVPAILIILFVPGVRFAPFATVTL